MTRPTALAPSPAELRQLRAQIEDLNAALTAIRHGGVDAVIIGDEQEERLYALTNADRPYRTIVEEMGEGAATVSQRGVLLFANSRLCELVQASPSELIGTDFARLVHETSQETFARLLESRPEKVVSAELTLARADATTLPVLASVTGLDIEGVLVRCLVVADLSEQKRSEQRLTEAAAQVTAHAAELETINAELARSNEELSKFAYITSHDLSEPLRSVTSFAELLQTRYEGRLDQEAVEFIDYIVSGTHRMQNLIDALLRYSRVDTAPQPFERVDTNRILRASLLDLSARIGEVHAEVTVGELPQVLGDPSQLSQVFFNLLRNSLVFVRDGVPPKIQVAGGREDGGWRFTVTDNGIGISPRHRLQVFGMFRRLHTQDDYPGTGIGLAIVEKVVHRHGGRVWIEGNDGDGTKVVFTLTDAPEPADLDMMTFSRTSSGRTGEL